MIICRLWQGMEFKNAFEKTSTYRSKVKMPKNSLIWTQPLQNLVITCSNCKRAYFIQAGKREIVSTEIALKHSITSQHTGGWDQWEAQMFPRVRTRNGVFYLGGEKGERGKKVFPFTQPTWAGPSQEQSCLTADFGEHLVNGLLDVRGGAASPRLALDHPPATYLSTQLVEYLGDVPFPGTGRTLIKSTCQFCGQLLPFFCTNLSGVVQVSFVSNQDESHILGLFDLIQDVLKWQHFLKTSSVSNVIDQHKAFPPSHVSFPLNGVFLLARKIRQSGDLAVIALCRCCKC